MKKKVLSLSATIQITALVCVAAFPSIPLVPQAGICENFFSPALHGQPTYLPNGRGNFFLSLLPGIILAIFQNAKNGRKKAGNLFLIPCFGVLFYVAAVIQFSFGYDSTNGL